MFTGHGGIGRLLTSAYSRQQEEILDVSASLSPLPLPEPLKKAYADSLQNISYYPEISAKSLCTKAADFYGLKNGSLISGCGSTEFIYLAVRALAPKTVFAFEPTYSDYRDAARVAGVPYQEIITTEDSGFSRKLNRLSQSDTNGGMVFICNPNNPTGTLLEPDRLHNFAKENPHLYCVIDEAYTDFTETKSSCLSREIPENMLILKSPTKFFNIPGLRLGYCLGAAKTISKLLDLKEPWTTSAPAIAVGKAIFSCTAYPEQVKKLIKEQRPRLASLLDRQAELTVFPAVANFLLVRINCTYADSDRLQSECLERGVYIRNAANFHGLDNRFFRVAVRTESENTRLAEAVTQSLQKLQQGS